MFFTFSNITATLALIIAVSVLAVTAWQAYLQRKSIDLQMFQGAFRDIRETEIRFKKRFEIPYTAAEAQMQELGQMPTSQQEWDEWQDSLQDSFSKERHLTSLAFFNAVEYMALLINHNLITNHVLRHYFDKDIPFWYERMYKEYMPVWEQDPKMHPEFKRLYTQVKN